MNEYLSYEYTLILISTLLVLSVFYNFRLRKALKEREAGDGALIKNAYFNHITSLPNSANMEIVITEQIERSKRHEKPFLICTIKLLKYSDEDEIIEFSNIILDSVRDEDMLGHIEDTVFLLLFNEYLEEKNFVVLLHRLQKNLTKDKKFHIEIGKSKYPDDSKTVSGLIAEAKRHIQ